MKKLEKIITPSLVKIIIPFLVLIIVISVALYFQGRAEKGPPLPENLVKNGGFEQGLGEPWGTTDRFDKGKTVWWNEGNCKSTAEPDKKIKKSGSASLHIIHPDALSPNVYGTMAQKITVEKGRLYKITLWAKGNDLASEYSVGVMVDKKWNVYPIMLPKGSFPWMEFSGTFSLPDDFCEVRIISRDKGEAWIDDISVIPLINELY